MANNYTELFKHYQSLTNGYTVKEALKHSANYAAEVFRRLPEEKAYYSYQPGKWTIAQLLSHVLDAERVFAYRALRFSRQDRTPLSSFDDDHYAAHSNADNRTIASFVKEFEVVRSSSILLFESFTNEMLSYSNEGSGRGMTVEKLGRMIAGHSMHHCNVLVERYNI